MAKVEQYENLKLLTQCDVTQIHTNGHDKASALETSKGKLPLGRAKLILAMSTLPSTILMLKSYPSTLHGIGERFTAHFASYIFARVPCEGVYAQFAEDRLESPEKLELAALYITGESQKSKHQFHIQLNAVLVATRRKLDLDRMRHLLKTPKEDMVKSCHNHIIFVCASLGEVDHENPKNKFYLDQENGKPTLKFTANDTDKELWETMDQATFKVLTRLCRSTKIEYWNSDSKNWQEDIPPKCQTQHKSLVHPASTMWIGDNGTSPVELNYGFRGVDNVYLTGGALWPTGASWNPTCAMTALAMHLADGLSSSEKTAHLTSCL